jgi:hypothetical protein
VVKQFVLCTRRWLFFAPLPMRFKYRSAILSTTSIILERSHMSSVLPHLFALSHWVALLELRPGQFSRVLPSHGLA